MIKIWTKIELFLTGVINKLENQKISLTGWLISFFAVVFLRNFLEAFSSRYNFLEIKSWEFFFFHSTTVYLCNILIFILFAYFLTKERIEKISRIALFGVFLILLPPVLDLAVSFGSGGVDIRYGDLSSFGLVTAPDLLKFFGGWMVSGPFGLFFRGIPDYPLENFTFNFGSRIEVLLVGLLLLWYIFLKTKNIFKVVLATFLFYFSTFVFFIFPFIFTAILKIPATSASFHNVSALNPAFEWNKILFSLFFILIFSLANLWFFIYDKRKYFAILRNIRPGRFFHNLAMFGLGLYLAGIPPLNLNFFDWLLIVTACLSLLFLWLSVVGHNDISDEEIDRISNPQRPLFAGFFKGEIKSLSNVFLFASLGTAFIVGYTFFVLVLLSFFVSHVYSCPPFRLKRFPIIATFLLALAYLIAILRGYTLSSSASLFDFPIKLFLFVLFAFTFGAMAKDIKDYEGDRKGMVYTIPVIFGLKRGKVIIGFLAFIVFFATPFFFFQQFKILILPSILAGILSFWLINKKKYSEKPLFLIYLFYGLFFILTVF